MQRPVIQLLFHSAFSIATYITVTCETRNLWNSDFVPFTYSTILAKIERGGKYLSFIGYYIQTNFPSKCLSAKCDLFILAHLQGCLKQVCKNMACAMVWCDIWAIPKSVAPWKPGTEQMENESRQEILNYGYSVTRLEEQTVVWILIKAGSHYSLHWVFQQGHSVELWHGQETDRRCMYLEQSWSKWLGLLESEAKDNRFACF